ncbi:MAG: metallopeptidase family protein [Deltaproteobacteria bacterium]|nr:metallopeptidase family protein [Deltaproteobacteria bacterium]
MPRPILHSRKRLLRSRSTPRPTQPCPHIGAAQETHHTAATFEEFARLVARALDTLPAEIAEKLENVAVTIEEQPSAEVLEEMGLTTPHDLFGLYRGVPRPWRSIFAPLSEFPDKIEIYYRPIVRACPRPREIRELVRRVVVHEVGHHFGMSDEQLRALGY